MCNLFRCDIDKVDILFKQVRFNVHFTKTLTKSLMSTNNNSLRDDKDLNRSLTGILQYFLNFG